MAKDTRNKIIASIIVATKYRACDLDAFLNSLKDTNHLNRKDIEIIIIDNTNGDNSTKNICKKFDVIYLTQPIKGKSKSQNLGIKHSRGRYLIFTDDDVIIKDKNWVNKFIDEFESNPALGYLSGNVVAAEITNNIQRFWENKGGLSKGKIRKYWKNSQLQYSKKVWPLTQFCAGANCAIPKSILTITGPYCELLGPGSLIGHGESIEIGYRIIKKGYDVEYNPEIQVLHKHPTTSSELKRKLFLYGIGDTALHMHIFYTQKDWRSLRWALYGHPLYSFGKIVRRITGKYPLPINFIIYSLAGSCLGSWLYMFKLRSFLVKQQADLDNLSLEH